MLEMYLEENIREENIQPKTLHRGHLAKNDAKAILSN